jgi:hypothetical protein
MLARVEHYQILLYVTSLPVINQQVQLTFKQCAKASEFHSKLNSVEFSGERTVYTADDCRKVVASNNGILAHYSQKL